MRLLTQTLARYRALVVRCALVCLGLGLIAGLPAALISPTTPAPAILQNWAFDVRLLAGLPTKSIQSLRHGALPAKRLYWDQLGRTVTFTNADLTIVGTLYEPPASSQTPASGQPGIVLLHGSTPAGRKLGLYRLLGHAFAQRGYVVLAIDLRGYGQSANPPDVQQAASFDFVSDVTQALTYLTTVAQVRDDQLFVIGHSFGGDVAVSTAAREPQVQKVVLIGPGRRFMVRGGTPTAPEFDYFRRREMRYMRLGETIPDATFMAYRAALPLENHLDYLTGPHQPILLIDGALESAADQQFLQTLYQAMSEPKAYKTLANADHYVNTANIGPLVIYDQVAVETLVQEIDQWLAE